MSNIVKRITDKTEAQQAVNNMIADMETMWDGFKSDGKINTDRKMGAWVKITVPMEDEPEAFTRAYLYAKDGEYVCIADFYEGEGYIATGTQGNEYTVNEYGEMEAA